MLNKTGIVLTTPLTNCLHIAAEKGDANHTNTLLATGNDVNARDALNQQPIHLAASNGHMDICVSLLQKGADIFAVDCHMRTPLFRACQGGHLDVVKLLKEKGADLSPEWTKKGSRPIHAAAIGGYVGILRFLIENKVHVKEKNAEGKTAAELANECGHEEAEHLITESVLSQATVAHDEIDLKFERPQTTEIPVIIAGTIDRLIERLAYEHYPDLDFMKYFLMTYRAFTTPENVLDHLIARYREFVRKPHCSLTDEKQRMMVLIRTTSVLHKWSDRKTVDPTLFHSPAVIKRLTDFANEIISYADDDPKTASLFLSSGQKLKEHVLEGAEAVAGPQKTTPTTSASSFMCIQIYGTNTFNTVNVDDSNTLSDIKKKVLMKRRLESALYGFRAALGTASINEASKAKGKKEWILGKSLELDTTVQEYQCRQISLCPLRSLDIPDIEKLEQPWAIAELLTFIDHKDFCNIIPLECINQAWSKNPEQAPNVCRITRRFNKVSSWLVACILKPDTCEERAQVLTHIIEMAQRMLQLNNLHGVTQALSGLQNAAVTRLKASWELVPCAANESFEKILAIMSPRDNRKEYRKFLRKCDPPVLPYLGFYLSDIVFLEDGNLDVIHDAESHLEFVHFQKFRMIARVIDELMRYQNVQYEKLGPADGMALFIDSVSDINEDETFERSLEVEPRRAQRSSIAEPYLARHVSGDISTICTGISARTCSFDDLSLLSSDSGGRKSIVSLPPTKIKFAPTAALNKLSGSFRVSSSPARKSRHDGDDDIPLMLELANPLAKSLGPIICENTKNGIVAGFSKSPVNQSQRKDENKDLKSRRERSMSIAGGILDTSILNDEDLRHRDDLLPNVKLIPTDPNFVDPTGVTNELILSRTPRGWYHALATRDDTEALLLTAGKTEGLYLVRNSSSSPGDYVLSVVESEKIVHYKIKYHAHGKLSRCYEICGDDVYFTDIPTVVQYYHKFVLQTTKLAQPLMFKRRRSVSHGTKY